MAEPRTAGDRGEVVSISVSEREERDRRPEGWLEAEVAIRVGAWSGRYFAQFHEDDFLGFCATSQFVGEGWDRPRVGSRIVLSYEMDQTALSPLQAELASLATSLSRTR